MPSMDERVVKALEDVTFIVTDATLKPSTTDDKMYQVLYLGRGDTPKNGLRGAGRVIVSDLDGKLVGAVERHTGCPHWYQQAPAEKVSEHVNYDTPQAALKALGVNIDL